MNARAALLAAGGFVLAWGITLTVFPFDDERVNDLFVYRSYAAQFFDGALPYRDVPFEYPPLAPPLLAAGGLAGTDGESFRLTFAALMLALGLIALLLTARLADATGGDARRALFAFAALPLLTGAMIRTHFDLAPVVVSLAALLALVRGRSMLGFALIGVGAATKLFPLAMAPVALAWLLAAGRCREALRGGMALAATVVVGAAIAIALSPSGAIEAARYHIDRPLQVESTPASVVRGLGVLGAEPATVVSSHRSDGVLHPAAEVVEALAAAAMLAALAWLTLGVLRRGGAEPPGPRELVLGSLAAVTAFAGLGKVLSPQYLIWTAPLLALAFSWKLPWLAGALAAATLLTLVEFPIHYRDVVVGEPVAVVLVAARDALLLGAVVIAGRALRAPRSRAPEPGRARLTPTAR